MQFALLSVTQSNFKQKMGTFGGFKLWKRKVYKFLIYFLFYNIKNYQHRGVDLQWNWDFLLQNKIKKTIFVLFHIVKKNQMIVKHHTKIYKHTFITVSYLLCAISCHLDCVKLKTMVTVSPRFNLNHSQFVHDLLKIIVVS